MNLPRAHRKALAVTTTVAVTLLAAWLLVGPCGLHVLSLPVCSFLVMGAIVAQLQAKYGHEV